MLIFALEIKGSSLGKIDFIKLANSILHRSYAKFHLPFSPAWNINSYGVSTIDGERWLYNDSALDLSDRAVEIPDANRPGALEGCRNILGTDVVELIRSAVTQKSMTLGKDFSSWRKQIGNGIFGLGSAGNDQIAEFILKPAQSYFNWVINGDILDTIPREKYTAGIDAGIAKASYGIENSKKYSAFLQLKMKLERLAIKDKKALIESGKTWKYRIYKLSMLDYLDGNEEVLYVGRALRKGDKWFFVDTCYSTTSSDYIEMDFVEGVEEGVLYALVGVLTSKSRVVPYGFVRLAEAN